MVVNVLLTTFPGLDLPSTLCLPIPSTSTFKDLYTSIDALLPNNLDIQNFTLIHASRVVSQSTSLVSSEDASFYSVTLTARLCGGKGGFGSQLRAAGGRMSSRKRKENAEQATRSSRNLDGRRLRTITEAKNLATYLATKPDADRKEKEEKRKRWEQVVSLAEAREADMKQGKTVDGRRMGLSSEWLEEKEEVGEGVKGAVREAMKQKGGSGSEKSEESHDEDDSDAEEEAMELDENDMVRLRVEAEKGDQDALWVLENKLKIPKDLLPKQKIPVQRQKKFAGFDDDEDSSSDEETAREELKS